MELIHINLETSFKGYVEKGESKVMILFCLPYAGGSEIEYYKWKKFIDTSLTLEPIELKGRGKRINENFYCTLEEAVDDILEKIKDRIHDEDYALFGHSMGSLLCYELYYKIRELNLKEPIHIFFSGYGAPCLSQKKKKISLYSDERFLYEVIKLGGMCDILIESDEFMSYFLPIIRNDFRLLENYKFKSKEFKIGCDITILNGMADTIKTKHLIAWKNYAEKGFKIYQYDGNHFFINNNVQIITKMIIETLIK